MWKKIIQACGLAVLALLLAGCKEVVINDGGGSLPHDAQCQALRHEMHTMNRRHHHGWTRHRIEDRRRMLWREYNKLGCP